MPTLSSFEVGTRRVILSFSKLKLRTGNLLLFDADNAANAMGRIDDILVRPETVSLLGSFLFRHAIASLLKIAWWARTLGA
jgi:hypothetical protein